MLGMALRKRRREMGLTQEAVAHAAGISTRHYQDIENGRKSVTVIVGRRLSKAMKSTLQRILDDAESLLTDEPE